MCLVFIGRPSSGAPRLNTPPCTTWTLHGVGAAPPLLYLLCISAPESVGAPLPGYTLAKAKMDELFVHWLSLRDTGDLLRGIVNTVAEGKPVASPPKGRPL